MTALSHVLVWAGVVVSAGTAIRLLTAASTLRRLHHAGPASALAAPLTVAGLAAAPGIWSSAHDVAKLVLVGSLLFVSGPVSVIATAHAARRASGRDREPGEDE